MITGMESCDDYDIFEDGIEIILNIMERKETFCYCAEKLMLMDKRLMRMILSKLVEFPEKSDHFVGVYAALIEQSGLVAPGVLRSRV